MNVALVLAAALQVRAAVPAPSPTASGPVSHARNGQVEVPMGAPVDAAHAASVVIDGQLSEPAWQTARRLTGFSLYTPTDQRPSPDSTDVFVWYSPTALYFGIRAYEPHGPVRATLADRDRISSDDHIEIHLDTFEERRRAFVFLVNPLGVQADGTKNEAGGFIPGSNVMPGMNDLSADFQWESRGHVTSDGYEVEIRIPFNSLRFPAGGSQRWGIQFLRHVQHSGYEETWTPVRRGATSFVAQEGWLTGLTGMQHGLDLTVNPELTSTINGTPTTATDGPGWRYATSPRLGGNVRAGLGSNVVLVGTIRPDFSQVEADATQVAADSRFALFYPERRPFFVEGSDQFNVPNTLVYTRRIVQPDAALKLTARQGRLNVALLSALDAPAAGSTRGPRVDVLRLSRDYATQSTAGLLYSDRVARGAWNRVVGADVRHVLSPAYYTQWQLASSQTSQSGSARSGTLWEGMVDHTGRQYGFHYNVLGISPDFQADNGFVARTGFVQPNAANRITLFGAPGAFLERYNVFLTAKGLWRYRDFLSGQPLLESALSANNTLYLRGGWSVSATPTRSTYTFDTSAFRGVATSVSASTGTPVAYNPAIRLASTTVSFSASTPQFRRFAATLGMTTGRDVDFAEPSLVWRTAVNGSLDLRPTERFRANATYASNAFVRRADGRATYSTRIPRVKVEYQLTRAVFVRLVAQYEATRREALLDPRTGMPLLLRQSDGRYAASVQRATNLLRADGLFSFRPRPGTVFFAGYGNSLTEPTALGFDQLRRVSDGFFLKASWLWAPLQPAS